MAEENYNEIECARCGGTFSMELTRCPHCGVSIYAPQDDLASDNRTLNRIQDALRMPFAVILGWFITAFVGLLLYLLIRFSPTEPPTATFVILLATITLSGGGFAGGFIYQRMGQEKSGLGSLSQILFSVLLGVAVFLTEGVRGFPLLFIFFAILGLLVIGGVSFLGIRLAEKLLRQMMIDDLFAPVVESQKRYQELLTKVGYEREVAERLIEHERQFMPKATRDILIENAIKRWERDNRVI